MKYRIIIKPPAVKDLDGLRKFDAVAILDSIETYLATEPAKESKTTIRKLRGKQKADYRLRVGEFRVFYSVAGNSVFILRVMHKNDTAMFYQEGET
jgi:mRNA-degrading endonuclease RelE of RelBE toxin-antitoxin system